jgi:hypothetical protein
MPGQLARLGTESFRGKPGCPIAALAAAAHRLVI